MTEKTQEELDKEAKARKATDEEGQGGDDEPSTAASLTDEQRDLFQSMVDEQLAKMKSNMDKMVKERDDVKKQLAKRQEEDRAKEIKAMEERGEKEQAYEARISDLQAELEALKSTNTALTRDQHLKDALDSIKDRVFKNPEARTIAFDFIQRQLRRDEDGNWVHATGVSLKDFVKAFSSKQEWRFLFDEPENRGTGKPGSTAADKDGVDLSKGVRGLSPAEAIAAAKAGKLGSKSY